ncbi:ribosomal biogenesis protein LAS1L [Menidia menidia]
MKKKSSEKKRHVVAWVNKAEWDQVLEYLYSKDVSLQRYAVHRISAWRGRFASSTPVAVDCTADLVRCQVLDRSGTLVGDDLVLLYGAALVRFVNLITEKRQGRMARPLRRLAGNLNIPEWVVDLRHDITHRKLPTLKWCRKGCKVVLDWLQQQYWSRQLGGGAEEDWESGSEDEEADMRHHEDELLARQKEMEAYKAARELLISYEKEQFQSFEGLTEGGEWPAPLADMSWLLGEIKQFSLESGELLVDVLLEDGFLVPTPEQLQTLGCDPGDPPPDPAEPRLPPAFLRFWLPLLKALSSPAFVHLLLEKLFGELKLLAGEPNGGGGGRRAFYVSAWASELIACNGNRCEYRFETKGQRRARMRGRVFSHRLQLRWQALMAACLQAPGRSTPHLLRLILDDMEHPLPPETRHRLLQLCSIYTQPPQEPITPPVNRQQQPIYTLESLHQQTRRRGYAWHGGADRSESPQQESKMADALEEKARALRGSVWQVCAEKVAWGSFPLGRVLRQPDDPSHFMVENYSTMTVPDQPVEMGAAAARSGPAAAPARPADGHLWNPTDVSRLKTGLKLF